MQVFTLSISDSAFQNAREIAEQIGWTATDVLQETLGLDLLKPPFEQLSDTLILALANATMPTQQQHELNTLLDKQADQQTQ